MSHDVIVVGAGLSGMVAAWHAAERGKSVLLLDQEGPKAWVVRRGGRWVGCSWWTPRTTSDADQGQL